MIDKKLFLLTILNYVVGLKGYKYLIIHGHLEGFGMFFAPFIWLGIITIALQTMSAINFDLGKYRNAETKEKVLPNLILVFINAMFPFIALLFMAHYEHLKEQYMLLDYLKIQSPDGF